MPSPLLSLLSYLGSANNGYQAAAQQQRNRDANAAYLSALQTLSNNSSPPPVPQGPGQSSLPMSSPVPTSQNVSVNIPQVPASSLLPSESGSVPQYKSPPPPPAESNTGLPLSSALPNMQPPSMPSPPVQQATQPQTYMGLVQRVVASVNQAMPNADPQTKSMVARELMETVVKGQQDDQQKQNALELRNQQLLERERNDQTIAGIRQQLADVAAQKANTSATQGQERIDLTKDKAFRDNQAGGDLKLSDQAINMTVQQLLAGDTSALTGIGRGKNATENWIKVKNGLAASGVSGQQLAQIDAEYQGLKSGERAVGTTGARVSMFGYEADKMAQQALQASASVPRGDFVPFNKMNQKIEEGTSSPELMQLNVALLGLKNTWAKTINGGAQPTVADKEHFDSLISAAPSAEALQAGIAQIQKELSAAEESPKTAKKALRDQSSSSTSANGWSFEPVGQ